MTFEERLKLVKISLTDFCKDEITKRYNWNNEFSMWSYSEIKCGYVDEFTKQFDEWITPEMKEVIWFAGQNLGFAVQTFIDLNGKYTLNELLEFVDTFLSKQIGDAENWASDIMMEMP